MLRANFFKFFKYKQNSSHTITEYNSNSRVSLQNQIDTEILEIDQKISENSKALIEAQIVKLRSNFSKPNNFIDMISQNSYRAKVDTSIQWHKKELKELYLRRKELQIHLEKIKGIFWLNRIKRFLKIIVIGFFIFLSLLIFLSGFMILIYLLPLIILIFLGYLISTNRY